MSFYLAGGSRGRRSCQCGRLHQLQGTKTLQAVNVRRAGASEKVRFYRGIPHFVSSMYVELEYVEENGAPN